MKTDFIRPICLPELADNDLYDPNEIVYVAGWGWTIGCKILIKNDSRSSLHSSIFFFIADVRSPSNLKRHVRVDVVAADVCRRQYERVSLNPVRFSLK